MTMTVVRTKTSFTLPLPKEPGIKAVRLFNACKAAVDECKKRPSDVKAIYENVKVVPTDLVEQVSRIDPCSLGDPGVRISYEETGCLWVRHGQISISKPRIPCQVHARGTFGGVLREVWFPILS